MSSYVSKPVIMELGENSFKCLKATQCLNKARCHLFGNDDALQSNEVELFIAPSELK